MRSLPEYLDDLDTIKEDKRSPVVVRRAFSLVWNGGLDVVDTVDMRLGGLGPGPIRIARVKNRRMVRCLAGGMEYRPICLDLWKKARSPPLRRMLTARPKTLTKPRNYRARTGRSSAGHYRSKP